jgi:hypothetical protein
LKGGPTNHEGRVEIYNPNTKEWGSVDNDYWSKANGAVVCNLLGLGNVVSVSFNSMYGLSAVTQYVGFECDGNEGTLFDCEWAWGDPWEIMDQGTTNYDDAGVVCSYDALFCELCESGYSDSPGSQTCKSCPLGYVANGLMPSDHDSTSDCYPCGPGTFSNSNLNTCDICVGSTYSMNSANSYCVSCPAGFVIKASIDDDDENDIALNHNDFYDCRPCDTGTYEVDGICITAPTGYYALGKGNTELTLKSCPDGFTTIGSGTDNHDTVDDCRICPMGMYKTPVTLPPKNVRLTGGSTKHEGRVEIYNPSTKRWGSIDNDYWSDQNGAVVCKLLGLGNVVSVNYESDYGTSTITQYVGFSCSGNEGDLFDCEWAEQPWSIMDEGTTNYDDAGVVCSYDMGSCTTCGAGQYSDVLGSPCKTCPPGYGTIDSTSSEAHDSMDDCMACGPGLMASNGICVLCMDGFYSTGAANSNCLQCPTGSITSGNSSTNFDHISKCVSCVPGTKFSTSPQKSNIRLTGGSTNHEGRVEIYNPNTKECGSIDNDY